MYHWVKSKFNGTSSVTSKNILQLKPKGAIMVQGNKKFYCLVIYLALAVSFVSGKINVTINLTKG